MSLPPYAQWHINRVKAAHSFIPEAPDAAAPVDWMAHIELETCQPDPLWLRGHFSFKKLKGDAPYSETTVTEDVDVHRSSAIPLAKKSAIEYDPSGWQVPTTPSTGEMHSKLSDAMQTPLERRQAGPDAPPHLELSVQKDYHQPMEVS